MFSNIEYQVQSINHQLQCKAGGLNKTNYILKSKKSVHCIRFQDFIKIFENIIMLLH